MTGSMVAARLLADQITGRHNSYADVFSPSAFPPPRSPLCSRTAVNPVRASAVSCSKFPKRPQRPSPGGHGGIVSVDGEKAGVYKDDSAGFTWSPPAVPTWAASWSGTPWKRVGTAPAMVPAFDYKGTLINNPALSNLPSWTL